MCECNYIYICGNVLDVESSLFSSSFRLCAAVTFTCVHVGMASIAWILVKEKYSTVQQLFFSDIYHPLFRFLSILLFVLLVSVSSYSFNQGTCFSHPSRSCDCWPLYKHPWHEPLHSKHMRQLTPAPSLLPPIPTCSFFQHSGFHSTGSSIVFKKFLSPPDFHPRAPFSKVIYARRLTSTLVSQIRSCFVKFA